MPWFPDFASAVELARQQTRTAGHADPVAQYFEALNTGDPAPLETVWPGEVVVYDPLAGEIRGHRQLRQFVRHNQSWLSGLKARTEPVASTAVPGRAVVELLAHVTDDGRELTWPVAVVAESAEDDKSVTFRTYCRPWPPTGPHRVRPPILAPASATVDDVAGRYLAALDAGDTAATVASFEPDGYYREPRPNADGTPAATHRGATELRDFFDTTFSAGGGIGLDRCVVTDDGERCALEYNCVRWGSHSLPPQAGIAVYERGPDGLLAAARVYDDVGPPVALA